MPQRWSFLIVLLVGLLFWAKGVYSLDPDFGFHLRMGEIIWEQGIPQTDPFSYTMPGFPDIDEAWLLDVVIASIYHLSGMSGLAVVFSCLTLAALWIVGGIAGRGYMPSASHRIPLVLSTAVLVIFAGVRPQVVTWFFLAILLRILFDSRWYRLGRWGLPLLFVLWANMHGGFLAGLGTVGAVVGVRYIRRFVGEHHDTPLQWEFLQDVFIFLLCILATAVNPYGWRIYDDVGVVATSSTARWTISEWLPTFLYPDFAMAAFFAFSLFFIYQYRRMYPLEFLALYILYGIQAISALRHMPLWVILSFPMTIMALARMWREVRGTAWGRSAFRKAGKVVLIGCLVLLVGESELVFARSGGTGWKAAYPVDAVHYLQKHPSAGNIFADYGWGGYLIWQLPEKKTFVDGRMALWKRNTAPAGESTNAFADYLDLQKGKKSFTEIAQKYGIDTVLWGSEDPNEQKGSVRDIFLVLRERWKHNKEAPAPYPNLLKQLKNARWKAVYQDEVATVWRKSSTASTIRAAASSAFCASSFR